MLDSTCARSVTDYKSICHCDHIKRIRHGLNIATTLLQQTQEMEIGVYLYLICSLLT
jgi:hypothetical protein